MTQFINQLVQFLQQGIAAIFKFVQLVWTWSFGKIVQIFRWRLGDPQRRFLTSGAALNPE